MAPCYNRASARVGTPKLVRGHGGPWDVDGWLVDGTKEAQRWSCRTGPWCAGIVAYLLLSLSVNSSFTRVGGCSTTRPGVRDVGRHGEGPQAVGVAAALAGAAAFALTSLAPSTLRCAPPVALPPRCPSSLARAGQSTVASATRPTASPLPSSPGSSGQPTGLAPSTPSGGYAIWRGRLKMPSHFREGDDLHPCGLAGCSDWLKTPLAMRLSVSETARCT